MTLFSFIFYVLATVILISTVLAITRRNLVHAVIYLIFSFFGSALLFYLLGAPFLAALEVIIYAGAIMVLFLFIIMMLKVDAHREPLFPRRQAIPAAALAAVYLTLFAMIITNDPVGRVQLEPALATPQAFGQFLFNRHWLSIEIVSLLLLVALVGVLLIGKYFQRSGVNQTEGK
jgi:NADH-quinone oxidoreductase subunit J